jgi:hypothetical protein
MYFKISMVRCGLLNKNFKPKVSHILSNIVLTTNFNVHWGSDMTHEPHTSDLVFIA